MARRKSQKPAPAPGRRGFLQGAAFTAAALATAGSRTARAAAPDEPDADPGPSQPPPLREVAGKVAYVTGGSSGIGLGIARVLRDAGMKVAMGWISEEQIVEAMRLFPDDPDVFGIRHDVLDQEGWERTAEAIEARFGKVHLLVNNAGVGLNARATSASMNDWEWGMGVNFWGPVYGVRTFLPRFRRHGEGAHIATVSSISGVFAGSGNGVYTVSKHAVTALMEELRVELHETSIGTSVMFPGFTASNIGQAERYRPERLRNPGSATPAPAAASATPAPRPGAQMDPIECAHCLLDGIRHNDLYIFSHPEWRIGTRAKLDAMLASFVDRPVPAARVPADPYRTPVYLREIAHRRRTSKRDIPTV